MVEPTEAQVEAEARAAYEGWRLEVTPPADVERGKLEGHPWEWHVEHYHEDGLVVDEYRFHARQLIGRILAEREGCALTAEWTARSTPAQSWTGAAATAIASAIRARGAARG